MLLVLGRAEEGAQLRVLLPEQQAVDHEPQDHRDHEYHHHGQHEMLGSCAPPSVCARLARRAGCGT